MLMSKPTSRKLAAGFFCLLQKCYFGYFKYNKVDK
jgi:hypothetical protein